MSNNAMENFDIKKYLEIVLRRKYWIVIPFMVVLLAGFAYLLKTPKIYEAKTLILVQGQKVPEDYVRSVVSTGSEDRLRTITQQVTSRTNCEKIITDYLLFDDDKMLMEEKVGLLIKNINIEVAARSERGGNAFTISFQGKDPRKVMQVTNALASNFITENLKLRESQAIGTSDFLDDELESKRKQLQEKEEQVKEYKEKYRGELPEERDTNLRMLERLQLQLDQLNSNLRAAENRKLILQQGVVTAEPGETNRNSYMLTPQLSVANELENLKNKLKTLQARYTDSHPDIIDLKKRIETLESQQISSETLRNNTNEERSEEPVSGNRAFSIQVNDVQGEITSLKREIEKISSKIKYYETKLEETPKRELELVSLNRDYVNLNNSYQSMLSRKLEAEISVNLERKQKGEQFRVIDSAQIPLKPVKPNVQKLILMIIGLGLGIGCGMAYLVEFLDSAYRSPDDAEKELGFPVLICLPYLFTEQELKARRKRRIIIASTMISGYCVALITVVITIKGFNETIDFVKGFLAGIS
jgi:polysaccharide chain length determinant protein (PEP-CTERM system associated)